VWPELLGQLIQQTTPNVWVRHFPTAEEHRQFDLITRIKKTRGLTTLGFEVMIVNFRSDPHLFELDDVLVLP